MQYGTAFTFAFQDQDWIKKFAIAALFLLIPIIGQIFLLGWGLEITRRVINEDPTPLPEWNNFGGFFIDGLKAMVIGFVYALPIILVQACSNGTFFFGQESGEDTIQLIGSILLACFGCLSLIYAIFLAVAVPAALGNFVAKDAMGAAFSLGEIFGLVKAAPAAYIIVVLTAIISPFIAMFGVMFCIIGLLVTIPYTMMVNQFMQGEAYRVAKLEQANIPTGINEGL